ncbi:hypothetical protein C7974DRAFT_375273 [Boeremia exigua]|uniref:uncharacterized protein n=1 Tax=Boeremia exigua TaxID=749465 RepID=UPI001E8D2405|nr:uncharacterized protein C7974DRAFT_375273 [Boeremia exigua]KAH6633145.1 hypothetical protein C7974DRAFT_375273 [Boeremia exigua]
MAWSVVSPGSSDWLCLTTMIFVLLLVYAGGWPACKLLFSVSMAFGLSAQLVQLLLQQRFGSIVAGALLWIVFCDYLYLRTPSWLRLRVADKVCGIQQAPHTERKPTHDQLRPKTYISAHLSELLRVHGNITFHEGPLNEVVLSARNRQYLESKSLYDPGETASNFTGIATYPGRPVAADREDIHFMLQMVWFSLEKSIQDRVDRDGTFEWSRSRHGITGLNIFASHLELLWHQQKPPVIDGLAHPVTDFRSIYKYEMYRARSFRPACLPGFEKRHDSRWYLNDEEAIKINQGCLDFSEPELDAEQSETLHGLNGHPDYAGAEVTNPVLGWLDDMDRANGFYDANAYLPCACGQKALYDHLASRYSVEPGYNPTRYAHEAPQLQHLDDAALDQDRQRKAQEEAHFSGTTSFPRSQTIAQDCNLHAIPTNRPWILMGAFDDPNEALAGTSNDLPVPGFPNLTKYPPGFRMTRGFQELKHDCLPPRCKHGYLHPPFTEHCMGCFPDGEQHDDCSECEAHAAACGLERDASFEKCYEEISVEWNTEQFEHAYKREKFQEACVVWEKEHASDPNPRFSGLPPLTRN